MGFRFNLDPASNQTKLQQLIHAINEAISNGVLIEGDFLPSVNQLSRQSGLSRDTIFKAYSLLRQRSIISSTPTKGYFVSSLSFKVMVLLDDFSAFKEQLYNSFRSNLPDNYTVDLLFHHYNPDVFDQLILNSLGRYSMYVVMNFSNQGMKDVLRKIDPNKLLLLDMGTPDTPDVAYLTQDFTFGVLDCLREGLPLIRKYSEFNLIFPETLHHPKEFVHSYTYFCNSNHLKGRVVRSMKDHPVEAGQAFLVIREDDLVQVIKQCMQKGLRPGQDVGLISYNDTPMKEIVGGGITTISVNFAEMGEKAARFVESKEKIFEVLPPRLIIRGSL